MSEAPIFIRALSLWQPWATLIAIHAKTIETRSWSTPYRGPLAIHAAKKWDKSLAELCRREPFRSALKAGGYADPAELPRGAVVALAQIDTVFSTDRRSVVEAISYPESAFGDFSPGRFGWALERIRRLPAPIELVGHQGLWAIDGTPILDALITRGDRPLVPAPQHDPSLFTP